MKAKIAAAIILIYAILFFGIVVRVAFLEPTPAVFCVVIVDGILFVGPAIGILRGINWCRILFGVWAIFIFLMSVVLPLDSGFRPLDFVLIAASGLPLFLTFFYPPLKDFTRNA